MSKPPTCRPKETDHPTVQAKRGEAVRVHRNLHNGCWVVSVRGSGGWRVAGYTTGVTLRDVRPRVGESRYRACKADQTRNVHAYLEGTLVKASASKPKGWKRITYNCKTGPGPFFYFASSRKAFDGAREVRLVQSAGASHVYVKGNAARENPPPCPCSAPGGVCSCGKVDAETPHETEPTCGDPGGSEGVACVACGSAVVLLDVGALKRISPDRFWEDSCPTVLGYAGPGGRTARPGWETALEYAEPEPDSQAVLGWVAGQLGGTPAEVEEHLLRNGEGWVAHELGRARVSNPLDEADWSDPGWAAAVLSGELISGSVTPEEAEEHLPRLQQLADAAGDKFSLREVADLRGYVESAKMLRAMREATAGAKNLHLRSLRPGWEFEVMIHPAVRADAPPGSWQLTTFGRHSADDPTMTPYGHNYKPSVDAALQEAWEEHGPMELVARANPHKRWKVRSSRQGLNAIQHPDITKNYRAALRFKPKHRIAVLLPCAQTKPFTSAPSYTGGYLPALEGKQADLWVVSEPLGVVPLAWAERYPNADYDFPPRYLTGEAHAELAGRVAQWFKTVAPKYSKVVIALPAHHARLVEAALEQLDHKPAGLSWAGIGDCLDAGACPTGHYRATSGHYQDYLRQRVRSNPGGALTATVPVPGIGPVQVRRPAQAAGSPRVLALNVANLWAVRQRGNPIDYDRVEELVELMGAEGQQEPIELSWWGSRPELVEGHHRLNAADDLGWETMLVLVDPTVTDETLSKLGLLPALPNPYVGYTDGDQRHYVRTEEDDTALWEEWLDSQGYGRVDTSETRPRNATPAPFVPSLEWIRQQLGRA